MTACLFENLDHCFHSTGYSFLDGMTLGRGKMTAMVRLLGNGNHLEVTAEEACHEKLAAQTIHREFSEADEANLLEEEDMHVFDSRPLADPLHLVCCNACKKPVKASQYAAHAERCRLINSMEHMNVELDGGSRPKKPPRKGRKKLQATHDNQGSAVGKQEKSESPEGDEDAVLECNNSEQTGIVFSSKDAKGSIQKQLAGKKVVMEHQSDGDGQNLEHGKVPRYLLSGIPSPLATKIYHSQGNHRLRLALGHIYIETVTRDRGCDARKKLVEDSGRVSLEDRSHHAVSMEATKGDIPLVERDAYPSTAVPNPDQILAESSEVYLGDNRGCPPAVGLTNQLRDGNFPRSGLAVDGASMGIMRSRYHPVAYPFPSNSGTALGKIQQPNGSVPVV